MNNACPNCGAVYAVTGRDIGRKLKCKKCSSALIVTDAGLVLDGPVASAPQSTSRPVAVDMEDEDADEAEEVVIVSKGKKGKSRQGRGGPGLGELLGKVGGIPTILFSIGVFLVIWFTFMTKIGEASALRDEMRPARLKIEMSARMESVISQEKFEKITDDNERKKYTDQFKKIDDDYKPKMKEAEEDAYKTRVDNVRSIYYDRWGTMFGFFFIAFGCIGYLRTEQPLVMRIVAGVILAFMMMVVFSTFGGCSDRGIDKPISPGPGIGTKKGGF